MRADTIREYANQADEQVRRASGLSPLPGIQALRAYKHFHPNARVHVVEVNGRVVWLTGKQYEVWCYVRASHHRKVRLRLADIAARARCSRATVSRFLTRLDLWRFVNVLTRVGRLGGVYILSRTAPRTTEEADANLSGARHTLKSRRIARDRLWIEFRRYLEHMAEKRERERKIDLGLIRPAPLMGGSTDATFMSLWGPGEPSAT